MLACICTKVHAAAVLDNISIATAWLAAAQGCTLLRCRRRLDPMLQAIIDACVAPLQPLPTARPVHWVYNELGGLLFSDLPKVGGWLLKVSCHDPLIGPANTANTMHRVARMFVGHDETLLSNRCRHGAWGQRTGAQRSG